MDAEAFERMGGIPMLRKINKIFYDKIYAHPWIGKFFQAIPQAHIESQQVDFMAQALGGPEAYSGRYVPEAHTHMFITEDLFTLRTTLLTEALKEAEAPEELVTRWLKIDAAFKKTLVKKELSECKPRYRSEEFLVFPDPDAWKKAG